MNDRYLIPANSKRGHLIFGAFVPLDLVIGGIGLVMTLVLFFIIKSPNWWQTIIIMLPLGIASMLIFPMPNYHNVRTFIGEMIDFFTGLRKYIWKGWCYKSEWQSDESRKSR